LEGPIIAAILGYGCLIGVTEKGPIREITRTNTFEGWKRIYGDRETRSDVAYEAEQFFKNGGVELLTSRICHYSDVDDPDTYTGGVSYRNLITAGAGATSAEKTGSAETYNMSPGMTVVLDVDNVGPATITWDAARAVRAGSGLSITDINGETIVLAFDGGDQQTVTFTATHVGDPDGAAAEINEQIVGGAAIVNAGEIDLYSDTYGTDSSVQVVSGTALTELGHTAGTTTEATSDVANIDTVTALEVEDRVENDSTAEVTVNADGTFTISSPSTGTSSELDFQSGTALTVLGLSVEVINGTAAGATYNTLKVEAGYLGTVSPGVRGNDLEVKCIRNPMHESAGAGSDLEANITSGDTELQVATLDGIAAKSVLQITDGTNTEYKEVLDTRVVITAGVVTFFVDLTSAMTNSYVDASTTVQSMEFDLEVYLDNELMKTHSQMSMLDTADNYVETVINDDASGSRYIVVTDLDADPPGLGADTPATDSAKVALSGGTDETTGLVDADWIGSQTGRTGLYAMDTDIEFMPFALVGNNNAAVVHSALSYAEDKVFLEFIGYTTIGLTSTEAIAYRKTTLGANSKYGSLYAGGIKVLDPAQSSATATRSIAGVGAQMGIRARVDNLADPNGGPWQSPAGEGSYGENYDAQDVATIYDDTEHGLMNVAGINVIRKFGKNTPVVTWGARTLYQNADKKWVYINGVRFFQYVQKSIVDSTRWTVFRNNDFRLWEKLKDKVDEFLSDLIPRRAFPTSDKDAAFYVKSGVTDGVMDQANIDSGEVITEVGMALNKPGEFIQFWFTQYQSATTIVEA
jgi:phage tail sheath protein FI